MRVRSSGLEAQPGLDPGDRFWADDGLDLPTLRLYASSAFMIWDCDYGTAVRVARELERSLERGDGHLAQREYRHAIMAHSAVALAILDYSEGGNRPGRSGRRRIAGSPCARNFRPGGRHCRRRR